MSKRRYAKIQAADNLIGRVPVKLEKHPFTGRDALIGVCLEILKFLQRIEVNQIFLYGYLERTSCIGCGIPAAGDHLISRLEAAPTVSFYGNLNFPDKRIPIFKNSKLRCFGH